MEIADLHIAQVSPREISAGAEKVALELHRRYLARGVDSWLVVRDKLTDNPTVIELANDARRSAWTRVLWRAADALPRTRTGLLLDRALRTAGDPARMLAVQRGSEMLSYPATSTIPDLVPTPPDVLHLHNLHGHYFDLRALPDLSRRVPIIYTLHDAWPLTGHCAYPMECERWRTGCGECPDLDRYVTIRRDDSAANARTKHDALARSGARIATPSRWLMRMVEESGVAEHAADTRVIPNGVDTQVFAPGDRAAARKALGLPHDATIVLFTALAAHTNPYKGFDTLAAALPLIAPEVRGANLLFLALGQDGAEREIEGTRLRFVPYVRDERVVAEYYRAADLYLHPSHAENHSLAILEAMASGLPVVASDAGGNPESVVDGVTGRVFPNRDHTALAAAAVELIRSRDARAVRGEAGANRVRELFTVERQADGYLEWYLESAQAPR